MPPEHRPLDLPARRFAHRGASAHAPENTIEAFQLALRLGTRSLESDVWLTRDGVAVLDHDGVVGGRLRRRPVAEVDRAELPDHVPTLAELYDAVGDDVELCLDVKDPAAADEVVRVAHAAGAAARLWMCHPEVAMLAEWRTKHPTPRLVNSTFLGHMEHGPERRVAELRELGIDTLNLHHSEWSAGLVALCHRFGRYAFGWDAQHERVIRSLWNMGIDGIFSDHVDRLVEATEGEAALDP
jgi:glycerophosphoryl diester phosphodiesterase